MPEPTDHRAEAEAWLATATTSVDEGADGFAQAEALIGIGRALLAGPARSNIPPGVTAAEWDEHCALQADPGTCTCAGCT